jgi:hypothetical protein
VEREYEVARCEVERAETLRERVVGMGKDSSAAGRVSEVKIGSR